MINFSNEFPDKLRSQILLSEVISKKVALKQRGKEFIGLCPFHNEKSPSFTVNNQKGFYHCFGCQASGDAITFKMQSQGLGFKDAVIELADEFNIEIPKATSIQDQERIHHLNKNFEIAAKISDFFCQNLRQSYANQANQYLKKRGIDEKIINKFKIGFAQSSYDALTKFLQNQGFSENEIINCGVIGKNDRGSFYDKFRNRIIFPISDAKGRIIAFGGRTIAEDLPKYLNSSETEIFKKSHTLYNISNARSQIFNKGYGILVEGYMDVVSLNIFGIENVVAGLGTAVSSDHISQLFRITDKIIVCLDGDSAGIKAAKRISDISLPLINSKKNLAFVLIPDQLDPDDFLRTFGVLAFEQLLKNAKSLSQFLFDNAIEESCGSRKHNASAEEKAKIALNLDSKIKEINDETSKKFFAQFFKDSLYLLGRNQNKFKNSKQNNLNQKPSGNTTKILAFANEAQNLALRIVAFLINFPWLVDYQDELFDLENCHMADQKIESLKDFLISIIDESSDDEFLKDLSLELMNKIKNSDFSSFYDRLEALIEDTRNQISPSKTFKNEDKIGKLSLLNQHEKEQEVEVKIEQQKTSEKNRIKQKFRLLLLKDFYLQLELQYHNSLQNLISDQSNQEHSNELIDQNISEIFNQKNSITSMIIRLEQEN